MATLSSLKNTRFFIILMGPPMSGKSVLASQFPSPWFVDLDFKLNSINAIKNAMGLKFNFDVTQINDEDTTDEDFIKLAGQAFVKQTGWRKVKKLTTVLCQKMPQDSTLVIDGLSRAGELLKSHLIKTTGKDPLRIQDWGTYFDEMKDLCDTLASPQAKPNVILIAHDYVVKDDITGAIERQLLVAGKSAARIPSLADEFWYLTQSSKRKAGGVIESTRKLQVNPDTITKSGSRSWLTDMLNPTYEKLKPYLEKSVGRELPPPTWTPKEA